LTVWLAAGPLALDQCLLGCHDDASTAAPAKTPPCHHADSERTGARWQPTAICHHDHSAASAETIAKNGAGSPLKLLHAAHLSHASHLSSTTSTRHERSATPPPGGGTASAFARPLRV
jgi:hypothetical protein